MAFDYRAIIKRAIAQPFFDTSPGQYAELLQIKVSAAIVLPGQPYWRAICGYHMTPAEAGGNPNVYLSAVNKVGQVEIPQTTGRLMVFGWDWEGRQPNQRHDPVKGDKGINEPSANINLGRNQIVTVWVEDTIPSDRVYNLRSDWPDALFHTGTFVCFQLTTSGTDPLPPIPSTCDELRIENADLRHRLQTIEGIAKI